MTTCFYNIYLKDTLNNANIQRNVSYFNLTKDILNYKTVDSIYCLDCIIKWTDNMESFGHEVCNIISSEVLVMLQLKPQRQSIFIC